MHTSNDGRMARDTTALQVPESPAADAARGEPAPVDVPPADRGPVALTGCEKAVLLDLARRALALATGASRDEDIVPPPDATSALTGPAAVFVTLTIGGELRGCVGSIVPDCPLWEAVLQSAISAALYDPRFAPLEPGELPSLHIEISVLGRRKHFCGVDAFDPGADGLIAERGGRRALLLPEVATQFGWGAREMLETVCRKAGLPRDAWCDERTAVFTFRTVRFGGEAVPAGA